MPNSTSYQKIFDRVEKVKGALSPNESKFLYDTAKYGAGTGEIVEIGSFQGRSTLFLANGTKSVKREMVFAIDPHLGGNILASEFSPPTYEQLLKNLKYAGVLDYVKVIKKYSWKARKLWKKKIRLLFIDGNHEFSAVNQDVKDWEPLVCENGIIAFHDALNPDPGPSKSAYLMLKNSKNFSHAGFIESIFYVQKKPPKNFKEYVFISTNKYTLFFVYSFLEFSKKISVGKIRRFMQQYVIKRWLKTPLTFMGIRNYKRLYTES